MHCSCKESVLVHMYTGTNILLTEHPQLGYEAVPEDPNETMCRKDTGTTKKIRRWSRGHQFIIRGGGHIDTWQPLYKYISYTVMCT